MEVKSDQQCLFETRHDKTSKVACPPSEDSDQPGHSPSLIRGFAVRMEVLRPSATFLASAKTLIRLGGRPD
ncbi:MAG: hypothetical protein AB2693_23270 [Candidatus Thiodiazotropha sp.]